MYLLSLDFYDGSEYIFPFFNRSLWRECLPDIDSKYQSRVTEIKYSKVVADIGVTYPSFIFIK